MSYNRDSTGHEQTHCWDKFTGGLTKNLGLSSSLWFLFQEMEKIINFLSTNESSPHRSSVHNGTDIPEPTTGEKSVAIICLTALVINLLLYFLYNASRAPQPSLPEAQTGIKAILMKLPTLWEKTNDIICKSFGLGSGFYALFQMGLLMFKDKSYEDRETIHVVMSFFAFSLSILLCAYELIKRSYYKEAQPPWVDKLDHLVTYGRSINTGCGPWAITRIQVTTMLPWAAPHLRAHYDVLIHNALRYGIAPTLSLLSLFEFLRKSANDIKMYLDRKKQNYQRLATHPGEIP